MPDMVKRSNTFTKDLSALSKDDEKENIPKPQKTTRKVSNAGANQNDRKNSIVHKPSFSKQDDGTTLRKRKASQCVRRKSTADRKRFNRHAYAFLDRVSCFGCTCWLLNVVCA
jgi:hypothetical protein